MLKLMGKKIFTPADNTRKRVWQYIEKERKKMFVYLNLWKFPRNVLAVSACSDAKRRSDFACSVFKNRILSM